MASITTHQQQLPYQGSRSRLRQVIARHPMASYLIMVYAVIFPIALPSPLTRGDFLPQSGRDEMDPSPPHPEIDVEKRGEGQG
jgi:hypothetical protein